MSCCPVPNSPCAIEDALMILLSGSTGINIGSFFSGTGMDAKAPYVVIEDQGENLVSRMCDIRQSRRRYRLRLYVCSKREAYTYQKQMMDALDGADVSAEEGNASVGQVFKIGVVKIGELWKMELNLRVQVFTPDV